MTLNKVLDISASAMTANQFWVERIANNMANATTTRSSEGGPYRREVPIFQELVDQHSGQPVGVEAVGVKQDPSAFPRVYNPGHPDADKSGFVTMPNVNVVNEMVDMMTANRSFEANVTVANAAKNMMTKAMDIGH